MIDKEKVIKALELEIKYPYTWDCKSECPYYSDTVCDCYTQLATDAIELLKEQEPVVPKLSYSTCRCGKCDNIVGLYLEGHFNTKIPSAENAEGK